MKGRLAGWIRTILLSALLLGGSFSARAGEPYDIVRINVQDQTLRLYWKDSQGVRFRNFEMLRQWAQQQGGELLFATNAGIFLPGFTPEGLTITEGTEVTPLNLREGKGNFYFKPNGVFYIDGSGAHIAESSAFRKTPDIRLATQSGPLLVQKGELHRGFRPQAKSTYIRSAVGIVSPQEVVFVISRVPVTFHELAAFMRDKLHCADALYLDGAISQMYVPALGRNDTGSDFAGMLAVIVRKAK